MHNFIVNFIRIHDICKKFAGNRVNEHGNVHRCGVIPFFSDLEVIALSLTDEAFGYDRENHLFKRLVESSEHIPNLISRRQFNARRKLTAYLAEDIRKDIATGIDGGETVFVIDSKPVKVCQMIYSYDMTAANVHDIHYLDDTKWDYHDCFMLGDKGYLSADLQQNLFETAHIKLEVPYWLNWKNRK